MFRLGTFFVSRSQFFAVAIVVFCIPCSDDNSEYSLKCVCCCNGHTLLFLYDEYLPGPGVVAALDTARTHTLELLNCLLILMENLV